MRHCSIQTVTFLLAGVYSLAMLSIELFTSQAQVRHYFTDITGPVLFYAVNTTLSVFLLAGAALLFAVAAHLPGSRPDANRRARCFDLSQLALFAGLALDDRFLVHEALGSRLGIEDALLLGAAGLAELSLLFHFRDVLPRGRAMRFLTAGGACTCCMLVIDAAAPLEAPLRLSFEDLFKAWGALLLFSFAWEVLRARFAASLDAGGTTPTAVVAPLEPHAIADRPGRHAAARRPSGEEVRPPTA